MVLTKMVISMFFLHSVFTKLSIKLFCENYCTGWPLYYYLNIYPPLKTTTNNKKTKSTGEVWASMCLRVINLFILKRRDFFGGVSDSHAEFDFWKWLQPDCLERMTLHSSLQTLTFLVAFWCKITRGFFALLSVFGNGWLGGEDLHPVCVVSS